MTEPLDLRPKSHWIWRVLSWFFGERFLTSFVTTIGCVIYVPLTWSSWSQATRDELLAHERIHVAQWKKWRGLFALSYLLLPLPFGLAWFRWRWEREAYAEQWRYRQAANKQTYQQRLDFIQHVADNLSGRMYGWAWPRSWIVRWMQEHTL